MRLFDTHCHLTDERFDEDREDVIARLREAGVEKAVVIGDAGTSPDTAFALADRNPGFYVISGLHPHDASQWAPDVRDRLDGWLKNPHIVALGEIGLDFHYDYAPRDVQLRAFDEQLDMALERNLPAALHIREAHGPALNLLHAREKAGRLPQCLLHCYSGSWETAREYLAMGMFLSLAGPVTFEKAPRLTEVAQKAPLDRIMVETDCPFLAPIPMRGHRNEPAFVRYTAMHIAKLRGMDADTFAARAFDNACAFYRITD